MAVINALQITLLVLAAIFGLLYLISPRRPRIAMAYLRYLVLGLASALVLSPFFWLLCAAFKDPDVLMLYLFLPPPSTWATSRGIEAEDVLDWTGLCRKVEIQTASGLPTPGLRLWQTMDGATQAAVRRIAEAAVKEEHDFGVRRDLLHESKEPGWEKRVAEEQVGLADALASLPTAQEKQALLHALQAAVGKPDFYSPDSFNELKAKPELNELIAAGATTLTPQQVGRRNRILLEALFPDQIRRSRTLSFDNFAKLLKTPPEELGRIYFWQYIANSVFLASAATMINLFFASLGGYALAKYRFRGRSQLLAFMLLSMMIPGILFLAPVYQIIYRIGWVDTYWALLVPSAASVFGMFLFRQAMIGVPDDLIEAGRIDGCSEFGIYYNLVMPLVRPMSGAFCLVTFLGSWNSFLGPQIYIHSPAKLPLPVVLNQFMDFYSQEYGVFLAGTLLAIIPPAVLFFALQKEFISGLTSGAVKG